MDAVAENTNTPPGPAAMSLRSRTVRASIWRFGCYFAAQAIRIVANIVLAKLLFPEAFGVVALATVFMQGLRMFSEIGLGPAIVRSRRADPEFLNTAWTLQAIRGFGLCVGAIIIAWPVSLMYGEPLLLPILAAVGLTAAVDGFGSTNTFTLNRQLAEGRRAVLEVFSTSVVGRGVMIAVAAIWPSPWALVLGSMAAAVTQMLGSHTWLPGIRNWFAWDASAARELASFGRWVFVGTIIAFFSQQLDKLMLGRLEAIGLLGVYTISLTVSRIPYELVSTLSGSVLYPALAEVYRVDASKFASQVLRARRILLQVGQCIVMCCMVCAPWFFELFYDDRYADARWIAPLAGLAAWFAILSSAAHPALLALGATRALAAAGAVGVVVTGLACAAGHIWFGMPGFVLGTALGALGAHVVMQIELSRRGVAIVGQDLKMTATLVLGGAVGLFATSQGLAPAASALGVVGAIGVVGILIASYCAQALRVVLPLLRRA